MRLIQADLSELIRIIRSYGNKRANSLFRPRKKNTKIQQLARKFAFEKNRDEHAWALEICGDSEKSNSYVTHRSLLRRELLDRVFHFDISNGTAHRKAIYRLRKLIFLIKVLLLFGARRTAMSLVPPAMKIATEYESTSDRIDLLETLSSNASLNGWKQKFERYDRALREAMRLRAAEAEITSLDRHIDVESVGRARPSKRAQRLAETAPLDALILFKDFPTFNVGLAYYRISVSSAQTRNNFELGLALCKKAQAFLSRFPKLFTAASQGEFELNRLWMALASRSYPAAEESALRCRQLFREGTNNWFIAQEYEFLLRMHTKQWSEAVQLHERAVNHNRFPLQPEQVRQKWELFSHYAALTSEIRQKKFPIAMNNEFGMIASKIPIYHKDKADYNTSLHILQYLILVVHGDQQSLEEKSDAIDKYIYRNFKGHHEQQSYAFLKTLSLLIHSNFDVERTKTRARRYIEQFSDFGHEKVDETQTLPFDLMWEWVTNAVEAVNQTTNNHNFSVRR